MHKYQSVNSNNTFATCIFVEARPCGAPSQAASLRGFAGSKNPQTGDEPPVAGRCRLGSEPAPTTYPARLSLGYSALERFPAHGSHVEQFRLVLERHECSGWCDDQSGWYRRQVHVVPWKQMEQCLR